MLKIVKNFRSNKINCINDAKKFVYRRRNIMNDATRRYTEREYPAPIVKEIGTFQGKKYYTYWVFVPCQYGTLVYIVENKDTTKKLSGEQVIKLFSIQNKLYQALNGWENKDKIKKLFKERLGW